MLQLTGCWRKVDGRHDKSTAVFSVNTPVTAGMRVRTLWTRVVLFALVWWILANGAMDSWGVGVPVVLVAAGISVALLPPVSWSLIGVLRFVPFFLWRSLRGGVDVAWRALHPRLPISPTLFDYRLRLPPGLPRVFMANTVSLLPGTLSAELDDALLRIHVLDESGDFANELEALENQVAGVFGLVKRESD